MAEIFVSHAGADKALIDKLVSFLKEGIGVPANSIFCSSIDGHNIPFTVNFNEYMKNELQNPELVIAVMTPKYMESWFCLMELGAAWSKFHRTLPIVVPFIDFDVVSSTLGLTQGWNIADEVKVIKLRETIKELPITLEKRTEQDWDKKKTLFASDVKRLLKKLALSSTVSATKYVELEAKLKKAQDDRDIFEDQYQTAQSMIEDLQLAKDKNAVKAIKKKHMGVDVDAEFNELIEAVSKFKPTFMTKAFFIDAIVMDYHERAIDIDFYDPDQKRMAQLAISSKLLSEDHGHPATWGSKLNPLGKAVQAVEAFFEGEDAAGLNEEYPIDASDRDFWEYHL
jgi:hypothetical protein